MHKIEIRNKIAIYLDHRELINCIYNNGISAEEETFVLRTELFHYHERGREIERVNTIHQPEPEVTKQISTEKPFRKRKRNVDRFGAIEELENLEALTGILLPLLKQLQLPAPIKSQCVSILPRYWDEISTADFPSFNGANTTTSFQHCRFGAHSYLIPPNCQFFNCNIEDLSKLLPQLMPASKQFDLIVLDPPWRNKYIRRLKRVRQELSYKMLSTEQLRQMPIKQMIHESSIVAIWCTNSGQLQRAILEELLPAWNLRLTHTLYWLKVNTSGKLIGPIDLSGRKKQPFEMLYIACHVESTEDFCTRLQEVTLLLSVPSVVHSHKPPLLPWLSEVLPAKPKCLELFARYLQPNFASVGLEVLKLMDERLYSSSSNNCVA